MPERPSQKLHPPFLVRMLGGSHVSLDIVRGPEPVEDLQGAIDSDDRLDEVLARCTVDIGRLEFRDAVLSHPSERDAELVDLLTIARLLQGKHPLAERYGFPGDHQTLRDGSPDGRGFTIEPLEERLPFVPFHAPQSVPVSRKRCRCPGGDIPTAFVVAVEGGPMPPCDRCGSVTDLPYQCRYCGGSFCGDHRLPESHDCPGLEEWDDPTGVFDSGFNDAVVNQPQSRWAGWLARMGIDPGPGGPLGYFRGNMTFVFLALMWVTFVLQQVSIAVFGVDVHDAVFVLRSEHVLFVWTWVTSVFAHDPGGLLHIAFNSIVLYFFGPIVERKIGSKAFTALFLGAGVAAGLSQVGIGLLTAPSGVVGASGAILAIMGVLTVLNPNLRVLLFFFIPMPLWMLTLGFAGISVFVMLGAGPGAGNIAHLAHLVGLGIGLVYGEKLRREGVSAPQQIQLGGGGGPPGGGRRRL